MKKFSNIFFSAFLFSFLISPALYASQIKNDPECPREYLYLGYDLVKGNPLNDGFDPGWTQNIMYKSLNDRCLTCVSSTVCKADYAFDTMHFEMDYYENLYGKVYASTNHGNFLVDVAFTGSAEYQYQLEMIFGLDMINIHAETWCQTYHGVRDWNCYSVEFTEGFSNVIATFPTTKDDPLWLDKAYAFFDDYGTHMVDSASIGARWTVESIFTKANYEAMVATELDIYLAAELTAEFLRTEGASAELETRQETELRLKYMELYASIDAISIGSTPPTSLSIGEWAENIEDPIPQSFELRPMAELFTSSFFPNDPQINQKREILEAAYLEYCGLIPGCHIPEPPEPPSPERIVQVSEINDGDYQTKNDIRATCPTGYSLIGGGCQTEYEPEPHRWILPSMKPIDNAYYCMANENYSQETRTHYNGVTAKGTCLHNSYIEDRVVETCTGSVGEHGSSCYARCDTGYLLTGGGCESNTTGIQWPWKVTASRPNYITNSWYCRTGEDADTHTYNGVAEGFAICTKFAEGDLLNIEQISEWSGTQPKYTNGSVIQCEAGYDLLSGGCQVQSHSKITEEWKVIENLPVNRNSWSCLGQEDLGTKNYNQNVETSALCALFR